MQSMSDSPEIGGHLVMVHRIPQHIIHLVECLPESVANPTVLEVLQLQYLPCHVSFTEGCHLSTTYAEVTPRD